MDDVLRSVCFVHHEEHEGHEGFGKGGFETRPYNFVVFALRPKAYGRRVVSFVVACPDELLS